MDTVAATSNFRAAAASVGLAGTAVGSECKPSASAEALTVCPGRCRMRLIGGEQNKHSRALNWKRDASFLAGETRILMPDHYHLLSSTCPSQGAGGACSLVRAFTEKQEALVKDSWEILRKDAGKHALVFFLRVFDIAPSTKRLFSFLRDSDLPLEKNPKLKSHALQVFVICCEAATSLRNNGSVSTPGSTLKNIANVHALSGIVDEHYDVVRFCLVKAIEEGLPAEKWSAEVKDAWTEAYNELVEAIKAKTEVTMSKETQLIAFQD